MHELVQRVLDRLDGVRPTGSGYEARCPSHDDREPSLTIAHGDDGRVLLHCHAGCETKDVCTAIGLGLTDLFPASRTTNGRGHLVATYDYRDAGGALLFQVVRFEPKGFRQRRPDGNGGWIWRLGHTPRVLYRLPELLAAQPDEWSLIVEGEKDADNLARLGAVATTCPQGAGKWNKLSDDTGLNGRRVAIIADKDARGRAHADDVAKRLLGRVNDLRILELPGEGKDATDWLDAGGTLEQLQKLIEATPRYSPPAPTQPEPRHTIGERPTILIDTEEHRVVCEAIAALTADPNLYQRGGMLVRVLHEAQVRDGIMRSRNSAMIGAVPLPNLRERLTCCAKFARYDRNGEEKRAHPAVWLVNAVDARGEWPGIRPLVGVSDAPVLRPDGSVWQKRGYDPVTCVLYEPASEFPIIPDNVGIGEARAAMSELMDVVGDFRFEGEEHKAAWLAALLTPLARYAFDGPTPLFLIDANIRGAGKGLLAQCIGLIVLGREMPVSSYSHDSTEMRKKITSIAIAGDRMILFDNLEGVFGNDALDRALTSTRWKDRILGKSQEIELPLIPSWYATGNNVQVSADTIRRIIHIRLDVLDEHPEDRTGFRHQNLLKWIAEHRTRLLTQAITILAAYLRAGRPSQTLTPFGSFEGWSSIAREAVVWVGLSDPCLTRTKLVEAADQTIDALRQLMAAWSEYYGTGTDVVVAEMLRSLYPPQREDTPSDASGVAMRTALENLTNCSPGKTPISRRVGNRLRKFRRRVVDGLMLDQAPGRTKQGRVWRLCGAGDQV